MRAVTGKWSTLVAAEEEEAAGMAVEVAEAAAGAGPEVEAVASAAVEAAMEVDAAAAPLEAAAAPLEAAPEKKVARGAVEEAAVTGVALATAGARTSTRARRPAF